MDKAVPDRGWTIGRILALVVAVLCMAGLVGVGIGGLCGLVFFPRSEMPRLIAFMVGSVVLFILCWLLIVAIMRRAECRKGDRV